MHCGCRQSTTTSYFWNENINGISNNNIFGICEISWWDLINRYSHQQIHSKIETCSSWNRESPRYTHSTIATDRKLKHILIQRRSSITAASRWRVNYINCCYLCNSSCSGRDREWQGENKLQYKKRNKKRRDTSKETIVKKHAIEYLMLKIIVIIIRTSELSICWIRTLRCDNRWCYFSTLDH